MREKYVLAEINSDLLPLKAVKAKHNHARLVQICSVNTATGYDLLYSFAEGYNFVNYKVAIKENEAVPSISDIYPSAALYENEIRELFGVNVQYINLDYHEKLYNIDKETPFKTKPAQAPEKPKFTPEQIEAMKKAAAAKKAAAKAAREAEGGKA